MAWQYFASTADAIAALREQGWTIVCLEQVVGSLSLTDFVPGSRQTLRAIVVGNEVDGVDSAVVDSADIWLEIPQSGTKAFPQRSRICGTGHVAGVPHMAEQHIHAMTLTTAPVKFPAPIEKGDTIAICSPAGPVDPLKVAGAVAVLEQQGWRTKVMPHALGSHGNFSGTADERYADMAAALTDPEVRAVLCSRGGYGVVHIMDRLARLPLADDPKWVIGFSDISAMHALMASKGVASIHSPMAAQIMKGTSDADTASLFGILRGERPAYVFPSHEFDRRGIASGRLSAAILPCWPN